MQCARASVFDDRLHQAPTDTFTLLAAIDDHAFGEDLRGRIETGLMITTRGGVGVGAAISYDGIGASDYQAIAGKARLRVPLN